MIANTADDVELLGVDVSPDPDLVTYWLSGEIDEEKGWGIEGDSTVVFDRLKQLGAPDWFQLSDRDLATCLYRAAFVAEGGRRTDAQAQIARALGVAAAVLPMCEERVRTRVRTGEGWRGLQEFLIADRGEPRDRGGRARGNRRGQADARGARRDRGGRRDRDRPLQPGDLDRPDPGGARECGRRSPPPGRRWSRSAPTSAGKVVKGPTDVFMAAIGRPSTAAGVASLYEGLIDGMVCDEDDPDPPPEGIEVLRCPTLMDGRRGRRRLAERTLKFAASVRREV